MFDDLKNNPQKLAFELYEFLEIDSFFKPDLTVNYNPGGIPKHLFIQQALTRPRKFKKLIRKVISKNAYQKLVKLRLKIQNKNLKRVKFPEEMRKPLINLYRDDIEKLQELINRDLSNWIK